MPSERLRCDERDIRGWDAECDVLVVGFGCAGAAAGIEAARAGTRVIVLERAGGPGGTSALSGGLVYLGGGTATQKACGFGDDAEEMFKYMMAACGPEPDAALVRPYCEYSVEHHDWLVGLGIPFHPRFFAGAHEPFHSDEGLTYSGSERVHPFSGIAKPAPRGHITAQVRNKGGLFTKKLVEAAQKAGVETRANHCCDALVTSSDGSVAGVLARSSEGDSAIRARRGVVLSTGGFIFNDGMLERYAPLLRGCKAKVGTEYDDGSGIRLGLAAGGEAIRMETGDISLPLFPPNQLRMGIFVNQKGQRFLNEDAYMGRAGEHVVLHQEGRAYLIVDDDIYVKPELVPVEPVAVAQTIAALERELALPETSLQVAVDFYNRHAEGGHDPLFHKSDEYLKPLVAAPFGALDLSTDRFVYSAFTLGGLRIDSQARVLGAAGGEPIPGLFAAGRATSGVAKQGYSSGMSLGDGTFFGRRAGLRAATSN